MKKTPLGFLGALLSAKILEALMSGLSQYLRALRLPLVHLGAALQLKLLIIFGI